MQTFLVLDIEATCERIEGPYSKLAFGYPNEIIEFPVIMLQWRRKKAAPGSEGRVSESDGESDGEDGEEEDEEEEGDEDDWALEVVDEFHTFVRPTWQPKLSAFCQELTGITQEDCDAAPTYPEALDLFYDFILKHNLFTRANRTVWCSDGPWGALASFHDPSGQLTLLSTDLRDFIAKASHISGIPRPPWLAGGFIDIRALTSTFFSSLKSRRRSLDRPPSPPPLACSSDLDTALSISPQSSSDYSLPSTPIPVPSFLNPPMSKSVSTSAIPSSTLVFPPTPPISPPPPDSALTPPASFSIPFVLLSLHLAPFEGRLHSGICDARNAARILIELARRGVSLQPNKVVPEGGKGGKERRWGWMKRGGGVDWEGFKEREERKMTTIATAVPFVANSR